MRLKPYVAFLRGYFLVYLAYRTQVLLWFLAEFFEIGFSLLLWIAIYGSSSSTILYGFTLGDMLLYQVLMVLTTSLTEMNPIDVLDDDYKDGKIAMSLIKPVNYELQVFFQNLGANLFRNVILLVPMVLIVLGFRLFQGAQVNPEPLSVFIFVLSVAFGLLINYLVKFIFSNLIFYTEASFGLWQLQGIIIQILAGAIIPLHFFPTWAGNILRFLPFASIQYFPVMLLMNRVDSSQISAILMMQAFWVVVLLLSAHLVWTSSMRNLRVNGG